MKVQVNVVNEMKKLRNSTYSDRLTWVDELVQNAQRSKATRLKVTVDRDKVIVEDNGVGCSDPQVLFDKSSSGWDEGTVNAQNPFGEGFFSTMMVANMIEVSSIGFVARFDVNKMFAEETVDCIKVKGSSRRSGFVVKLTDLVDEYSRWDVIHRFKEVGKYIQSPKMVLNGERVKYIGTNPDFDSPFIRKCKNALYTGWLSPFVWGKDGYNDDLVAFAFSRKVKELVSYDGNYGGIKGCINFADGAVTLRSPDRKDLVMDDAYYSFKAQLKEDIKKTFLGVIKKGSAEDVDKYAEHASRYLKPNDYKNLLSFKFVSDEVEAVEKEADEEVTPVETIDSVTGEISQREEFANVTSMGGNGVQIPDIGKSKGVRLSDMGDVFYVKPSEMSMYSDELQLAKLYDIPVVEIRNCLEEAVANDDSRFSHISLFRDKVRLSAKFADVTPIGEAERRANKVLNTIGMAICGRKDLFYISDIDCRKVLELSSGEKTIEQVEAFATAYENSIYINRKYMAGYMNLRDATEKFTDEDRRFVLLNIDTIAHEMAHALFGTVDNTKEHFEIIGQLVQRIINVMYGVA